MTWKLLYTSSTVKQMNISQIHDSKKVLLMLDRHYFDVMDKHDDLKI